MKWLGSFQRCLLCGGLDHWARECSKGGGKGGAKGKGGGKGEGNEVAVQLRGSGNVEDAMIGTSAQKSTNTSVF